MEEGTVWVCEFQVLGWLIYLFVEPAEDSGVMVSFLFGVGQYLVSKSQLSHSNITSFFTDDSSIFRKTWITMVYPTCNHSCYKACLGNWRICYLMFCRAISLCLLYSFIIKIKYFGIINLIVKCFVRLSKIAYRFRIKIELAFFTMLDYGMYTKLPNSRLTANLPNQ